MDLSIIKSSNALSEIKELAKGDLKNMDLLIEERLSNRDDLVRKITYHIINSGGKRLRPTLLILVAKLFNYSGNRHINLAAAVEFIHTATLLHDDVVDHSNLRRGKPTANKYWDNKSSILVGDFLFSQSFLLMAEDSELKILQILSKAASIIAEGEVKQLSSIANLGLKTADYLQIITAKTAELFAASCQVGAAIAKTSPLQEIDMYNFGLNLGIAFQIIDDVLDYSSNRLAIGKNIGDDFKESKVTLPIIIAYGLSGKEDKLFWSRTIENKEQNEKDFSNALEIINKHNVIKECFEIARSFINKAKDHLREAPNSPIKTSLLNLLDFSLNRQF